MKNIVNIAKKLNINLDDLELYGNYMAKVNIEPKDKKANLILVTAISPTKYGEGKTTVSIGLHDSLSKLGMNSLAVLREPSLGPVFGMKGGACGGGKATILPDEDINLHFTGDFHAITAANNLLASAIDNHIYQGNSLNIDENRIEFKRCLDVNDRALRDKFNITAASEVMAIFCLASDLDDLRKRLGDILVGYTKDDKPIFAKDLKVDGAMFKLLKKAFVPNLVQTVYENPVLVHGGPFANIAHGCSSIASIKLGLGISDYVITEAGFGSDLGFEKFMNITSRYGNFYPDYVVLVATVRGLKHSGIENLGAHIDNIKQYNVPFCVALNQFSEDTKEDIEEIENYCKEREVKCISTTSYIDGEDGSIELAKYITQVGLKEKNNFHYLYESENSIKEKIEILAKNVYHAGNIEYSDKALNVLDEINKLNLNNYPICVAKTQYSISDNKDLLGYPKDYTLHVKDIRIQTGSRMIIILLNDIITMPGLPKVPNYESMQ